VARQQREAIEMSTIANQRPPEDQPTAELRVPTPHPPTCCKDKMIMLIRRAILHSDGQVDFASVWNCQLCGRLVN
jgi:hypothetical protein